MNYSTFGIGIGDLLTRPKALGLFDHRAVLVAPNQVLQNTPESGEHLVSLSDFCANQPIKVSHSGADPITVATRARKILAKPRRYDAFLRNCEHTANELISGIAKSPQLFAWLIGTACFALLLYSLRRR